MLLFVPINFDRGVFVDDDILSSFLLFFALFGKPANAEKYSLLLFLFLFLKLSSRQTRRDETIQLSSWLPWIWNEMKEIRTFSSYTHFSGSSYLDAFRTQAGKIRSLNRACRAREKALNEWWMGGEDLQFAVCSIGFSKYVSVWR